VIYPDARPDRHKLFDMPALEPLESRLLLAADPTFAAPLSDYYVLDEASPLTIGIDGFDADADDSLSISVAIAGADPGVTARIYDYTSANRYALLHFADADGNAIGDVLVQLFEGRSPTATDRFITLATNYFDDEGNPVAADVDNPAFYTDVTVHRIITEFMIQTGDAANGDGTGGSPLGDFSGEHDSSLSFAGRGVLAMANAGAGTNDSQFFITDVPTTYLDGSHPIFGQLINGWDVYQTLINVPTDANDRPENPPVLSSIEIIDSPQDGSISLIADDDFTDPTDVTVTLTDDLGNTVEQTITLVPADQVGDSPTVGSLADLALEPGEARTAEVDVTHTGPDPIEATAWSNYDGEGDVGLTITPGAETDDPYTLDITLPAEYDGRPFTIAVGAALAGYGNLIPSVKRFELSLGDRPTVDDPGAVRAAPGGSTTVALTITDTDATEFTVSATTENPDTLVTIDPDTYELTITAPADVVGRFEVAVSAVESGFAEFADLPPATQTITVATIGDAPTIAPAESDQIVYAEAGETLTFDAGITDDVDIDLVVDLTSRINSSTFEFVRLDPVEDAETGEVTGYEVTVDLSGLSSNFSSSIEVVLTALEEGYDDLFDPVEYTFHVVSRNEYDPLILDYLIGEDEVKTSAAAGDRFYVGAAGGLEIYDITDPLAPDLLGSYATDNEVSDIIVVGDTAFVSTLGTAYGSYVWQKGELLSLDVTDPENITELDSVTTRGLVYDIDIEGDRLYVANGGGGLVLYDISDPGDLDELGAYTGQGKLTVSSATAVAARDDFVYLADGDARLIVLNALSTMAILKTVVIRTSVWGYQGSPAALAIQGDTLYLADQATGLYVFDLTQPALPRKTGWLGWPSSHLAVNGDLAVISLGGFHRFVDVSGP